MSRSWARLLPYCFALAGLCVVFHVQLRSGGALAQPNEIDSRLIQYILERTHRILFGPATDTQGFWHPPIFHPRPGVGAFSESMLGQQPFYSLARLADADVESAFQGSAAALLLASFWSAYSLFRRGLGQHRLGASAAAFLFAFALPRSAQLGHVQLFAHYATPLALLGLCATFSPDSSLRKRRWGVSLFWLALALQLFGSFYLAWFFVLSLVVGAGVAAFVPSLRRSAAHALAGVWQVGLAGGLVAALVAGLYLAPHLGAREHIDPLYLELERALPRLQSFLYGGAGSWESQWLGLDRWERIRLMSLPWEQALCPGLVTLGLAAWGFWRRRRTPLAVLIVATAAGVMVILLRFPGGFSLWQTLAPWLPGGSAIRAPSRVGLLLLLPFGLGVSWALCELAHRGRRALTNATTATIYTIYTIATVVVVLEQAQTQPSYPKGAPSQRARALAELLPADCDAFLYTPLLPRFTYTLAPEHLDAMFASLETGVPTLNGYSGYLPQGWWPQTSDFFYDFAAPWRLPGLAQDLARLGAPPRRLCWLRVAFQGTTVAGGSRSWTDPAAPFGVHFETFGRTDFNHALGLRIFGDGFESGDLSRWQVGGPPGAKSTRDRLP